MTDLTVRKLENFELFLLNLRYKEGRLVDVEGNKPILLNDPDVVWLVFTGMVDVFAVPLQEGETAGVRTHIFRAVAGQLLFGMDVAGFGRNIGLLVSGTPGTKLLRMRRERLLDMAPDLEYRDLVLAFIEDWVLSLSAGVFRDVLPKEYHLLEAGQETAQVGPQVVVPKKGVLWLRLLAGKTQATGKPELTSANGATFFPITRHLWWETAETTHLQTADTPAWMEQDPLWSGLEQFHRLAIEAVALNQSQETTAEYRRLQKKAATGELVMENALTRLSSPLTALTPVTAATAGSQDALFTACQLVGNVLGIEMQTSPAAWQVYGITALKNIARASRVRTREVTLQGGWWQQDNGPLLGFLQESDHPVALLPTSAERYEMVDPTASRRVPVTPEAARQLQKTAYMFYRPLPNRALAAWDLLRFGLQGSRQNLRAVLFIGTVIALLELLPPVATSLIFDTLIPQARRETLIQVGIGLLVIALAIGLLQIARGIALLRLQSKMDAGIQAALWDRLLTLPLPFFRLYNAGDLGTRAMGISTIRRILSGYVITTLVSSLFSTFNLVLLFFYSVQLALIALGIILVALVTTAVVSVVYVRYQRILSQLQGEVSGRVLQLLTGVIKFRVAGAENQAFSLWAEGFTQQKTLYYRARKVTDNLMVYNAAFPLVSLLIIFAVIAASGRAGLSTGDFLAFNLAFAQFLRAWTLLTGSLVAILSIIPIYERLRPVLEAESEVDETKANPGELSGKIEISHVSFRYKEKGPPVLRDISLDIAPGEFVAFVGPSGSGKSTLLRLLLGFDKPESGGIFYDDQDLADLDLREVRRQLGVVLQNAMLMVGDIYENIVGSTSNLTLDDAWEAARMAGLDRDIEIMPMGMNTMISERGGNLSGGQRQRVLIARAIVNKPRILIFDEATSALDNRTQEIVSRSMESLQATRIVIAHRLSTIINTDRIYVFEKGQIVQMGTYQQLMDEPGPFAELAKRQTV